MSFPPPFFVLLFLISFFGRVLPERGNLTKKEQQEAFLLSFFFFVFRPFSLYLFFFAFCSLLGQQKQGNIILKEQEVLNFKGARGSVPFSPFSPVFPLFFRFRPFSFFAPLPPFSGSVAAASGHRGTKKGFKKKTGKGADFFFPHFPATGSVAAASGHRGTFLSNPKP